MNSTDALRRLRDADPARSAAPLTITASEVRERAEQDADSPDAPLLPTRRWRPSRRVVLLSAAAAVAVTATAIPMANPFAPNKIGRSSSGAAFAVDPHPDGTVQVDLTESQLFTPTTPADLQQALRDAGINAVVMRAARHGTCDFPRPLALPEIEEFEPPDLARAPTNGIRHFTLRPSAIPPSAYLLVAIPPAGADPYALATDMLLTRDPVPQCIDYGVYDGPYHKPTPTGPTG